MQNLKPTGRKLSFTQALRQARNSKNKGQFIENYGLAIGLVVVALAGILILYYVFGNSTSVGNEVGDMTTAVSSIQNQYHGDANGFANITSTSVLPSVPSDEVVAGKWVAPVGGAVAVAPANSFGTAGDSFSLTLPNVPGGGDCTQLVSAFSQALSVTVGGTAVVNNLAGGTGYSATTAETACGTSSTPVAIVMTFGNAGGT